MKTPRVSNGRALVLAAIAVALLGVSPAWAEETEFSAEQIEFFEMEVRPVLADNCYECHSGSKREGGLRLDAKSLVMRGGDSGRALVPGEPDRSRLIRGIRYRDVNFQMPPRNRMSDEDIAVLERWVEMGAPMPDDPETLETDEEVPFEVKIEQLRETHWSFQPVKNPQPPEVENQAWVQNSIDQFILAKLEEAGLEPSPKADRRTLIRRAYFDLIGLPPTYEQVEAFVNDDSPNAWEKVVDELLASPHYGERWARHWMDIARYGDTAGYLAGNQPEAYPYAYTYRDYLINAFNNDKPYDEFIVEQLAADKIVDMEADNREELAGLGFLTVGRRFQNNIHDIIDDRIDVTTRGFMGLTVACARCHDHMFDPVSTKDYYAMYGIFRSADQPRNPDDLPLVREPKQTPEYEEYQKGVAEIEARAAAYTREATRENQHEVRSRVADYLVHKAEVIRGAEPDFQGERGALNRRVARELDNWIEERPDDPQWRLWHELAELPEEGFAEAAKQVIEKDREEPVNARILAALKESSPTTLAEAAKAYGTVFEQVYAEWQEATKDLPEEEWPDGLEDEAAEQIRAALLTSEEAPLTLASSGRYLDQAQRNRLGGINSELERFRQTHPGAPARAMVIVDGNLFDPYVFLRGSAGNRGDNVPRRFLTVLDHIDDDTYDDTSGRLEIAKAIANPENPLTPRVMVNRIWQHHFGHGIVRTPSNFGLLGQKPTHPELLDYLATQFMENGWSMKQMHRMMMLSAAYQQQSNDREPAFTDDPDNRLVWKMNRQRLEFEPMRDSVLTAAGQLDRTIGGQSVNIHEGVPRRALYAYLDREDLPGIYRDFDVANPDATTAVRSETTVPQQALFMMNSPFMIEQARVLAGRVAEAAAEGDVEDRIKTMYRLTLSREPSRDELALGRNFIDRELEGGEERPTPRWSFGYGTYDTEQKQVTRFEHLPHYTGSAWQGGPEVPDDKLSWARLTADGGHPGRDNDHAVIRRFVAPVGGTVTIEGTLKHPAEEGDGVLGWIVSDRHGELAHVAVHNGEAATAAEGVTVQAGDVIDFIVAPNGGHGHDSFTWAPVVRYETMDQSYQGVVEGMPLSAEQDFVASSEASEHAPVRMDAWSKYAQVLLLSNEFVFVD